MRTGILRNFYDFLKRPAPLFARIRLLDCAGSIDLKPPLIIAPASSAAPPGRGRARAHGFKLWGAVMTTYESRSRAPSRRRAAAEILAHL